MDCFKEKSLAYLKENGSRRILLDVPPELANVAPALSIGYGLVDYLSLEDLLPFSTPLENFKDLPLLFDLLLQKKTLLDQFSQTTSNPLFQSASNETTILLDEQRALSARLSVISSTDVKESNSLIEENKKAQIARQEEITATEKKIAKAREALTSLESENTLNDEKLSPFLAPLEELTSLVDAEQKKVDSLRGYLRDIEALLKTYKDQLPETFFTPSGAPQELISAPWSLEEIEKKNTEMQPLLKTYRALQAMETQLAKLRGEFDALLAKTEKIDKLTTHFLTLNSQKTMAEESIKKREQMIQSLQQIPAVGDLTDIEFFTLLVFTEGQLQKQSRSYDEEFSFHEKQFEVFAQKHKEGVQKLQMQWKNLLCDWKSLAENSLNAKKLNCLIVSDFLNERKRMDFLEQLSPQILDSAINIETSPWTQSMSKIDYLADRISGDLNLEQRQIESLLEIEQQLRVITWRWSAQQKTAQELTDCESPELTQKIEAGTFSQEFYEELFFCEKKKLLSLIVENENTFSQSMMKTIDLTEAKTQLEEAQNEMTNESLLFMNSVNQLFKNSQQAVFLEDYYVGCLDLAMGLEDCQKSFQLQNELNDGLTKDVKELDLQIQSRSALFAVDIQTSQQEVKTLMEKKSTYVKENGIEPLIATRDSLNEKLLATRTELTELQRVFELKKQNLNQSKEQQLALQQEATQIIAKLALLSVQIINIQNAWDSDCASFSQIQIQADGIDQKILELLKPTIKTPNTKIQKHPFLVLCSR